MSNWSHVEIEFPGITDEQWEKLIDIIRIEPSDDRPFMEWDPEQFGKCPDGEESWGKWMTETYGTIIKECGIYYGSRALSCRGRWDGAPDKLCDIIADRLGIRPICMYWSGEGDPYTTYYYRILAASGRFGVRHEYGSIECLEGTETYEEPAGWWRIPMLGEIYFKPRQPLMEHNVIYQPRLDDAGNIIDDFSEYDGTCGANDTPCPACGKALCHNLAYRYYPKEHRLKTYGEAVYCGWCDYSEVLDADSKATADADRVESEQCPEQGSFFFCSPYKIDPECQITRKDNGEIWVK